MNNMVDLHPELLSNCEQEPIHIPGLIQPHGVLLVLSPLGVIEQISANADSVFGQSAESLLNQSFTKQVPERQRKAVTAMMGALTSNPKLLPLEFQGHTWNAFFHTHAGKTLVEIEAPTNDEASNIQERLRLLSNALQSTHTLQGLCQVAVDQVRAITGHDRAMLYRFDADWHGEVVAESCRPGMYSYLGHHFPASDIPKQAREMLLTNWVRMIPDSRYTPVAIVPSLNPTTKRPIDIGQAILRSVSPVHLQYLQNMEVGASITVSLINNGKLWGLIACHHPKALHVAQEERFACELVGRIFSSLIDVKIDEEIADQKRQLKRVLDKLYEQMKRENDLSSGLTNHSPNLLDLTHADGAAAAILIEGQWSLIGKTPTHAQIESLTDWLHDQMGNDAIFYTNSLPKHFPEAVEYKDRACGIMAISIPKTRRNFVLWFRPEVLRVVTWAGDPKKQIEQLPDGTYKIEPRHSFEAWKETQKLKSKPWSKAEIDIACDLRSSIIELDLHRQFNQVQSVALKLKKAKEAAEAANSAKSSFLANMSHEIRTPLGAIMGFVNLMKDPTIPREESEDYLNIIERNSHTLLRILDDILDLSKVEAGLMEIESIPVSLVQILNDFDTQSKVKAREKKIDFNLLPQTALPDYIKTDPVRVRQILNNIVGNAIKFTSEGHVDLAVSINGKVLEFAISDTGPGLTEEQAQRLFKPFAQADVSTTRKFGGSGLGLVLTRRLCEAMGGNYVLKKSTPNVGSTFVATIKVEVPQNTRMVTPHGLNAHRDQPQLPLENMNVLLVEDVRDNQTLISIFLKRSGATIQIASDGEQGYKAAKAGQFHAILMDIQMPIMDGVTVTKKLRADGLATPIVALTAHASKEERSRCLEAGFNDFLSKPILRDELIKMLKSFHPRNLASS